MLESKEMLDTNKGIKAMGVVGGSKKMVLKQEFEISEIMLYEKIL